jgi:hypothetical protein
VDGTDFGIVAANFNMGVNGWDQGDFNYDGVVDGTDFGDVAANFNQGVSGAAADVIAVQTVSSPVKSPAPVQSTKTGKTNPVLKNTVSTPAPKPKSKDSSSHNRH